VTLLCKLFGIWCLSTISGPAYVQDGDTIYIARQAVRLYGIDAEELDEPHGQAAKEHLEALTRGRIVHCKLEGWSYQRRVGVCDWLNIQMVADGYALDCARYSGGRYRQFEPVGIRSKLIQKPYC
jgi:micrococcal nuclease